MKKTPHYGAFFVTPVSAGGGPEARKSHDSYCQVYVLKMPFAKAANEAAIRTVLSVQRSSTYVAATGGDTAKAVDLYGWNARISAALMLPSHFAEVSTRNAVSDALSSVYGPRWPWNTTFEQSLPSPNNAYNPKHDLLQTRSRKQTTGKVIADLSFAFWESMFTSRHTGRIWNHQILALFPNSGVIAAGQLRRRIHEDLETIRKLRNRLAHHEPIFTRNLGDDLMRMLELIELRSIPMLDWVLAMEEASDILSERP
jgi:hypothetical protein